MFEGIDDSGALLLAKAGRRDAPSPPAKSFSLTAMLLAIDAGNTNIVFAVHDGEAIRCEWRAVTEDHAHRRRICACC